MLVAELFPPLGEDRDGTPGVSRVPGTDWVGGKDLLYFLDRDYITQ